MNLIETRSELNAGTFGSIRLPIAVQVIIAGIASNVLGAGIVSAESYLKRRKVK